VTDAAHNAPPVTAAPGMRFNADVLGALELAALPHWVCWCYEQRPGEPKPTKPPRDARTGAYAKSTVPKTWAPFDVAVRRAEREGWGVGFVFDATLNPFAGIDLDACRDPQTGLLVPWAQSIVSAFNSYTEISPSGCGCKIIVRGKPRHNGKKAGANGTAVEVYGTARFFTLTGVVL
jgi:putative DNA primase/helicase